MSDAYGQTFKRARLDAAKRRGLPELEDRDTAAKAIGIAADTLRKMENGDRRPSFEILESMARAYGCMIADLFPSSSPKSRELDRLLGPLYLVPEPVRSGLIDTLGDLARKMAEGMGMASDGLFRAVHEGRETLAPVTPNANTDRVGSVLASRPADLSLDDEGTDAVPGRHAAKPKERA